MVTRTRPPQPTTARIRWHRMSARIQDALVTASDPVKGARSRRGKECKGAMTGEVSTTCDKADEGLTRAVVDYVRSVGQLPTPEAIP